MKLTLSRSLAPLALALSALVPGTGCSRPSWSIQPYEYVWSEPDEGSDHGSILIDQRTGRTWVLMSDESGYYWEPIPRRDTPTPPEAPSSKALAARR